MYLSEGDRVRIDIPDEDDPDFQWHGEHGVIIDIIEDDAGLATGDARDSVISARMIYEVIFINHSQLPHAHWR